MTCIKAKTLSTPDAQLKLLYMWRQRGKKMKWASRPTASSNKCRFLLSSRSRTRTLNRLSQGTKMTTSGRALSWRNLGKSRKDYYLYFVFHICFISSQPISLRYSSVKFLQQKLDFPPQGQVHDRCNNLQFMSQQILDKCHKNYVYTTFCILI